MLKRLKLLLLIMFSGVLPFGSYFYIPILCLIESPSEIWGTNSCCKIPSSVSLIRSCGGIYNEQIFFFLCKVASKAISWRLVLRLVLFWGMSFLIRIETPPEAV